jgi:putative endonuclease
MRMKDCFFRNLFSRAVKPTSPNPLSSRPTTKDPKGTEAEWRDPDNVSPAMLMQGVLSKLPGWYLLRPCETAPTTNSGFTFSAAGREHFYVGLTGFFERRIYQHKYDTIEGFTRKYQCHRLVHYESFRDVHAAIAREKQVKRWRREKKIALIEKFNPRWQDLAENWGREMRFRGQRLGREHPESSSALQPSLGISPSCRLNSSR